MFLLRMWTSPLKILDFPTQKPGCSYVNDVDTSKNGWRMLKIDPSVPPSGPSPAETTMGGLGGGGFGGGPSIEHLAEQKINPTRGNRNHWDRYRVDISKYAQNRMFAPSPVFSRTKRSFFSTDPTKSTNGCCCKLL